jgi:hypothetical protein
MVNEAEELFKEIARLYGINTDEVEDIFYEILKNHFGSDNIILDDEGIYVDGHLYEYFNPKEIRKFKSALEDKVQSYSVNKLRNYFEAVLRGKRKIKAVLEKEGKKHYYFKPFIENEYNEYLKIQVPKTNVRFDFPLEKGNEFIIYLPEDVRVFRKDKPVYFNKYFVPGKVITKEAVKDIIKEKMVDAFSAIYTVDDFKVKYISPIRKRYGIINIVIKKKITANLLNFLDNVFKRYGYIVSIKEKNV